MPIYLVFIILVVPLARQQKFVLDVFVCGCCVTWLWEVGLGPAGGKGGWMGGGEGEWMMRWGGGWGWRGHSLTAAAGAACLKTFQLLAAFFPHAHSSQHRPSRQFYFFILILGSDRRCHISCGVC